MPLSSLNVPSSISTTFLPPKELLKRADVTLPLLYAWHAANNANYPLFLYHDGHSLQYITYSSAYRAIERVARYVASNVQGARASADPPVVALMANSDTITYFCTIIGILRAGCAVFLVSTRNGPAAVADMMQRTNTRHIMVSSDEHMSEVAKEALLTTANSGHTVNQLGMPTFEDLFAESLGPQSPFEAEVELPETFNPHARSVIMHSSGSTGHPKPIAWEGQAMAYWALGLSQVEGVNYAGLIIGCHGTPMFHAFGMGHSSAAPLLGWVLAVFKPTSQPPIATPDAVWQGLVATHTDYFWGVPSFIEEWARDPEKVAHMARMGGLVFGGAALNEKVGDSLASAGVCLCNGYGCTETGIHNVVIHPTNPGMDWAYYVVAPGVECVHRPVGDGTYEPVFISRPEFPLGKTNTIIDGREAYATNDLVVPHPTKKGWWKIIGRADEQIMLSNGEKTNPLPLEKMINEDPHVKSSVMFGRGKLQNGVLIEPVEDYAFDPSDLDKLANYRNRIWPTIERVNEFAPQHSRIFKEMILVTSPTKPFEYTAKGQPRRNNIVKAYETEIEALYQAVEESAASDVTPPAEWDEEGTRSFVRAVVESTLRQSIPDDADIFRCGGDSLQATWIRNTIIHAIREAGDKDAVKHLPMNLVFAAPTIASLARIVHGAVNNYGASVAHTPEDLWKYVERYSANLPARPGNLVERTPGAKDVVVITGTTGGFGCDTLEHLLKDEAVGRVYAFNRKASRAMERQRAQFRARGLDETLLDSPKFVMVEADLHEPGFGVDDALLDEIRNSVTHIMHNAWKVNFNLSIVSFQDDMQSARNLVDLALSSPYTKPPTIVFVSSIGVFQNYKGITPVPEAPLDDPEIPFGSGYSESKWVTEHVLQNVRERTDVHTVVMRLGQVGGDRLGYWNEREWFPSLVKSALTLKCLPDVDNIVSWFPAYEAAKAFAEMRRSPEPFLHLVHPHPTSWHTLIAPIAHALNVALVPPEQWLAALETSASGSPADEVEKMKANPALHLLSFFKGAMRQAPESGTSTDREAMGLVLLSTEKATRVSESLARMPQLDAERAMRWVDAWKKAGFL